MASRQVSSWLDTILSDCDDQPKSVSGIPNPSRKRRRLEPPTPESSARQANDNVTPQAPHSNEREQTPRDEPRSSPRLSQPLDDESSGSEETCLLGLYGQVHDWYGVKDRELSEFNPLPPSLQLLLEQIKWFGNGEGILTKSARRRFKRFNDLDMEWARNNRHYAKERQAIWEIASPDDVRKVVCKAAECSDFQTPDANWDVAVNSKVLDMALERANGIPAQHA